MKVEELAAFIRSGGDAKEFMAQFHPEDAVLINDQVFAKLYGNGLYSAKQADIDCLPFLMQCSADFVQARKEISQCLLKAFDTWIGG